MCFAKAISINILTDY